MEDWGRLKRVVASLGAITVPGNVPRIEGGEKSYAENLMENIPSLKENFPREEASNVYPSKKKRCSHKDGSKKTSRTEKPSSNKGQEIENVYEALHPKIEKGYERCLNISSINLWRRIVI